MNIEHIKTKIREYGFLSDTGNNFGKIILHGYGKRNSDLVIKLFEEDDEFFLKLIRHSKVICSLGSDNWKYHKRDDYIEINDIDDLVYFL